MPKPTKADFKGFTKGLGRESIVYDDHITVEQLLERQVRTPITQCDMRAFSLKTETDRAFMAQYVRVDFKNFPLPLVIDAKRYEVGEAVVYEIQARACVRDRNSGAPSMVLVSKAVPVERIPEVADILYRLVRRLMLHEVSEAYHLDNVRTHDPHAEDEI